MIIYYHYEGDNIWSLNHLLLKKIISFNYWLNHPEKRPKRSQLSEEEQKEQDEVWEKWDKFMEREREQREDKKTSK
jgi:hypothetical protein